MTTLRSSGAHRDRPAHRHAAKIAGALVCTSALVLAAVVTVNPVSAQREASGSVLTPMGRAPLSFADIAERVTPAVVSISVSNGTRLASRRRGNNFGRSLPDLPEGLPESFKEFFRNMPRQFGNPPRRPTRAQGSGFVVSADGYVVTNNHVIDKATRIRVTFDKANEGEKYDAELVGTDPRTDIALLKIKSNKTFPYVRFADNPARVGDWVLAVGNPFGLGGTVTAGIVSALARGISAGPYDYLQIDAAVNRGNSGGPTFNLNGNVIGVNTAIYSPSGGNVGIAFAVPAATVKTVVEQLKTSGSVERGWLGVKIQNLDEDMAQSYGLTETSGALIQEITADSPAQAAGLKVQDVILRVDGRKIRNTKDLALKIAEYKPNTVVAVEVMRRDAKQTIRVKLGRFPSSTDELSRLREGKPKTREFSSLGLTFDTDSNAATRQKGVRIAKVEDGSDAAGKGLSPGDVITHINGEQVRSPEDIERVVKRTTRRSVRLTVKNSRQTRVVAIKVKRS